MILFDPTLPPNLSALVNLIPAFLNTEGLEAKHRFITQYSTLLLSDEALSVFEDMLAQVSDQDGWEFIEAHQRLLRRCRAVGVEQAFSEARAIRITLHASSPSPEAVTLTELMLAFLNAPTLDEKEHLVTENQEALLSDSIDAAFGPLLEQYADQEGHRQALERHRELLARCREIGIEAAFEEARERWDAEEPAEQPELDALIDLVIDFVNADSMDKKQRIVTENQDALLSFRAEVVLLNLMAKYTGREEHTRSLEMHRALLRLCRTRGVQVAFAQVRGEK